MKESALDRAAVAAGISLTYTNAKGEPEAIGDETKTALLAVMGDAQKEKGAAAISGGCAAKRAASLAANLRQASLLCCRRRSGTAITS